MDGDDDKDRQVKIGVLRPGLSFGKDVPLNSGVDPQDARLIAFIREPEAGKVIGVTTQSLAEAYAAISGSHL